MELICRSDDVEKQFFDLDYSEVKKILKNREPMLLVRDVSVIPGEIVICKRTLRKDEWFFPCHFPNEPLLPGVLQLEMLFEMAALAVKVLEENREKLTNVVKVSKVSFLHHIRPDDSIVARVYIDRFKRGVIEAHGTIECAG